MPGYFKPEQPVTEIFNIASYFSEGSCDLFLNSRNGVVLIIDYAIKFYIKWIMAKIPAT